MLRGINELSLDDKGRLSLPARYHEHVHESCGGSLVITIDADGCLLIYPLSEWESIEKKLQQLPNTGRQVRDLQRMLLGHATDCKIDGQNRILLPTSLRQPARLDKHVVLIGQGNKFELWDKETWEAMRTRWIRIKEQSELKGGPPAELETLSI